MPLKNCLFAAIAVLYFTVPSLAATPPAATTGNLSSTTPTLISNKGKRTDARAEWYKRHPEEAKKFRERYKQWARLHPKEAKQAQERLTKRKEFRRDVKPTPTSDVKTTK